MMKAECISNLKKRKSTLKKEKRRMTGGSNQRVVGKHQIVANVINHYTTDPPCRMLHSSYTYPCQTGATGNFRVV